MAAANTLIIYAYLLESDTIALESDTIALESDTIALSDGVACRR